MFWKLPLGGLFFEAFEFEQAMFKGYSEDVVHRYVFSSPGRLIVRWRAKVEIEPLRPTAAA